MLVLSRKNGECVQIGECIEVKVLEIGGGKVKLGFTAPSEVSIRRNEICGVYPRPSILLEPSSAELGCCTS